MVEVGQVISGKYRLLRLLGDGGMGSVYEAEHLTLGTRVAIKVLHGDLARRTGIAERFLQEARVSAQIRSSHVVQVIDVDRTSDGVAYLVMELLQGETLSGVIRRERTLAVGTACIYASQILQALEAAHALGVIHRDLKPDNVFVTFLGGKPVIKLIDFGIAKLKTAQLGQSKNLTVAGMLMGTPEYMAPEQAYSADKVDVRADLYAVGVMLYEMLSGKAPATADDPRVLILKVERGEVVPLVQVAPGIEPQLAGFVHRSMAPRPELRFANATEMRMTLEDILAGKRVGTAKLSAAPALPAAPQAAAAVEIGTGTVMGAPVEAALAAAPPHAFGGTAAGAPLASTYAAPPGPHAAAFHSPQQPPPHALHPAAHPPLPGQYEAPRTPAKRGGNGLVIALAVVALLLGAGAVVAYVVAAEPSTPVLVPIPTMTTTATAATTSTTPSPPSTTTTPVTPVTPLTTTTSAPVAPPPTAPVAKKDAGSQAQPDASAQAPVSVTDAGGGQTTITTPFGTFQFPGPRPPFYPADQPWPPPTMMPSPPP